MAAWSTERRAQLQAHLRRLGNTPAVTVHGMGDAEGIMSVLNTAVVNVAIGKPASADVRGTLTRSTLTVATSHAYMQALVLFPSELHPC
jgi:hypothetical protein